MTMSMVGGVLAVLLATGCATPAALPAAVGEQVTVTRVVDGDTLALADGRRVRLLGIDSCESGTPGGTAATTEARELVPPGATIVLEREPGADLDRYGRLLRYVNLPDGRDFGLTMVAAPHTGIYRTGGDASPGYVNQLRAADRDGRVCG